jgi:hypothetical protein
MRKRWRISWTLAAGILASSTLAPAQGKRLWVLRAPGEMVEYDPATFAVKQKVKVLPEAVQSPQGVSANHLGQILFAPAVSLPLVDTDIKSPHKAWFWNGQAATTIDLGVKHETVATGSNLAVTESAPAAYLSANGEHLFWFANQQRRLQREDVDLSTTTTWEAWQTDLEGSKREDLISVKLAECSCKTGACEETCPNETVWAPENGVEKFFLLTQFVAGKDEPAYKASTRYREENGKWSKDALPQPLHRVLDAASGGDVVVEAIPDTGCCGWSNQSDDLTLLHANGKTQVLFDEQATYKNADYDISFFTADARLSPDLASVAMTISATSKANQPIQLAEQGQGNPEELKRIHKALADLPAVEIKTADESPRRLAFLPHASVVGWISAKDVLLVEDHLLVAYNLATGVKRKSTVRVDDAAHAFLR